MLRGAVLSLVGRPAELFPNSAHIFDIGLAHLTSDQIVEDLLRRHTVRIAELEQSSRSVLIIRNAPEIVLHKRVPADVIVIDSVQQPSPN